MLQRPGVVFSAARNKLYSWKDGISSNAGVYVHGLHRSSGRSSSAPCVGWAMSSRAMREAAARPLVPAPPAAHAGAGGVGFVTVLRAAIATAGRCGADRMFDFHLREVARSVTAACPSHRATTPRNTR
jgi:hypothetical protein